jgi:hypothetical protein
MSRTNRRTRRLRALEGTRELSRLWIKWHRNHPLVLRWIEKHPAPPEWTGTPFEYAWLEMPNPDSLWGRWMLWLGL